MHTTFSFFVPLHISSRSDFRVKGSKPVTGPSGMGKNSKNVLFYYRFLLLNCSSKILCFRFVNQDGGGQIRRDYIDIMYSMPLVSGLRSLSRVWTEIIISGGFESTCQVAAILVIF